MVFVIWLPWNLPWLARNRACRDVIEEAASLFESLVQNHPFLDGNKRTAFTASAVFLAVNGYLLDFEDAQAYEWLIGLFEGQQLTKSRIEEWLRAHASAGQS
ncbi:MAG TPA: type II toxin-antitoxin system death-on-curing family toxin [Candidatus Angelobacter sp.]